MEDIHARLSKFNNLYKEYDDLYRDIARYFGLSDCALWIIYLVRESSIAYTQSEICTKMLQSKQTVNSAMKKLEELGLLELKYSDNNRKSKQIFLTARGEELAERTADKVQAAEKNAFASLSEEEQKSLLLLTEKYMQFLRIKFELIQNSAGGT